MRMPETGIDSRELLHRLATRQESNIDWKGGKTFAYSFHANDEVTKLAEEAYRMFLWDNALDPTIFPALLRFESEIVAMCSDHLHGDDEVVGNFTSGGTESVLLAVKTARDYTREHRPEVTRPNMVLPSTAHPCFHKAAEYFDLEKIVVPVDPETCTVRVEEMRAAITSDTILLVGSATSYAHGSVDPIPEIGRLAVEKNLLFHVDGCIGGFLLNFFRDLGESITEYDFAVPGVTSISMDLHKYAFCPKGASVVLYRNPSIRKHQIFSYSGWPGYSIVNPTMQSSKSGGPLAAAWAVMNHLGREGYLKLAAAMLEMSRHFRKGIAESVDFELVGNPQMTLFGIAWEKGNIFQLEEELKRRGYVLHSQLERGGIPANLHVNLMPANGGILDSFLADLVDAARTVREGEQEEGGMLRAAIESVDLSELDDEGIARLLEMVGLGTGQLPGEGMAEVNEIFNALPHEQTDRLLKIYFNGINRIRQEETA